MEIASRGIADGNGDEIRSHVRGKVQRRQLRGCKCLGVQQPVVAGKFQILRSYILLDFFGQQQRAFFGFSPRRRIYRRNWGFMHISVSLTLILLSFVVEVYGSTLQFIVYSVVRMYFYAIIFFDEYLLFFRQFFFL